MAIDIERFGALAGEMPREFAAVAESGVGSATDVTRVVGWGYRIALIGTTLMSSPEPKKLVADLLTAGRAKATPLVPR